MPRRSVLLVLAAFVMLVFTATPALAHVITGATVTPSCSSYTITVTGSQLFNNDGNPNPAWTVQYTFTLTPDGSAPVTISDSVAVFPDPNGNFLVHVTKPMGPFSGTVAIQSGSATLTENNGTTYNTVAISFVDSTGNGETGFSCGQSSPPPCPTQTSNASNFNGTPIAAGDVIWFNSNFTAKGVPSSGATLSFTNSTIQFTAEQPYNLAVPNGQVTFSPGAACASMSFDTLTNTFMITVPVSGDDEIFLTGLAFSVPAGFGGSNGTVNGPVVWNGTLSSSTPGITVQLELGAAAYTKFTTDYYT